MPLPERAMTYRAAALLLLADAFVPSPLLAQSMPGVFVETTPTPGQTASPPPPLMPAPQAPQAQEKPPSKPKAEKPAAKAKKPNSAVSALPDETKEKAAGAAKSSGQSIVVLVNDEPITAYEIQQRSSFLALSSGGGGGAEFKAKAEARWKQLTKDPKTNERFKELLQKNNVTTKEQAQALQAKFVKELQQNMVEQIRRESRSSAVAGSRDKAIEELVEEKLKLQEAKRLNAVTDEAEIDKIITGIAEKNKMTQVQFGEHMKGMGVDIKTMRARFRAELSWREVVRRRFGHLINITDRDVDRLVSTSGAGEDDVELQLQRITLAMPAKVDQKLIAQRIADADGVAAKYSGCANTAALAATVQGAKFEDLGARKPATIQEPTRTLLLNARDGDMLPPSVGPAGIEIWAVCGRKVLKADDQKRELAQGELRQKEFEILAKKHLKDLRQDAAIEYR
jgi:peptidyl-prolyl cis-trans isomerase SurA